MLFRSAADIDELQVPVAEAARAVVTGDADVVVDPERDVAAEVAGGEDAKQPGFKVRQWNEGRNCVRRRQRIEARPAAAGELEIVVVAQSNRWNSRNGARPDRLWPEFLVCRSSKHHGRNFQHRRIVRGEFETCILERFAEVIQFGKVDMTSSAARAVLPGESRNGVARPCQRKQRRKQNNKQH